MKMKKDRVLGTYNKRRDKRKDRNGLVGKLGIPSTSASVKKVINKSVVSEVDI